MQDSMYSAIFGALSAEFRMNSIANNLANVNTTGYKRDLTSFKDTFINFAHDVVMEPVQNIRSKKLFADPINIARTRIGQSTTDYNAGGMKITGAPLDLALSGEGFFKVTTPDGSEYYTKNGHFRKNAEGMIISEQGWPVSSAGGGEVLLPPGSAPITIAEDGRVLSGGVEVGQIGLFTLDNPENLEKFGRNLYRPRAGTDPGENLVGEGGEAGQRPWIAQGYLESSNVDPVYEMVNMIEVQRQFEMYQKVMQTTDALDREAYSKVGRGK